MLLQGEGHGIIATGDPREAVTIAAGQKPDLCLLDHKLPGMDGIQTMKMIKAELPVCEFILISWYVAIAAKIIEENAVNMIVGCLQKPFAINELLQMVKSLSPPL